MPKLEEVTASKSPTSNKKLSSKSQTEKHFKNLKQNPKNITRPQNTFLPSKTLSMQMHMNDYDGNTDFDIEDEKTDGENIDGEKLDRSELKAPYMSENSLEEVNANELTVQNFKPLRLSVQYDQYSQEIRSDTYGQTSNFKPNINNLNTTNSNGSRSVIDSKVFKQIGELNPSYAAKENVIDQCKAEMSSKFTEVITKEIKPAQPTDDEQKVMESIRLFFHKIQPNVNIKNEDTEKAKYLEVLSEKLNELEIEKKYFVKHFEHNEKNYLNKIKSLEKQILNAQKVDIELLRFQNKEYENQIGNLKKVIEKSNRKSKEDKSKFNEYVTEVIKLKEKLSTELKVVEKLKKKLSYDEDYEDKSSKSKVKFILKENNLKQINEDENELNFLRDDEELFPTIKNSQEKENPIRETLESFQDTTTKSPYSIGDLSMNKKLKSGILRQQKQVNDNVMVRSRTPNTDYKDKSNTSKSSSVSSVHNLRK